MAADWFVPANEIHRCYDQWGLIQVFDDGNKRYLSFGTTDEQSCQLKARPHQLQHDYSRAMLALLTLFNAEQAPRRVTLLGLGAGSMASTLLHLLPDASLDAVELREAVARIARQYFGLQRNPQLTLHTQDAGIWLALHPHQSCELMISDLYLADGADRQQLQEIFLDRCLDHLAPGGWLVLNLWREHREQLLWLHQLKQRFPTLLHHTTKDGNWILWARKAPLQPQAIAATSVIREQARHWSEMVGFNLWQVARPFLKHYSDNNASGG